MPPSSPNSESNPAAATLPWFAKLAPRFQPFPYEIFGPECQ
jgi:hypothetical protein